MRGRGWGRERGREGRGKEGEGRGEGREERGKGKTKNLRQRHFSADLQKYRKGRQKNSMIKYDSSQNVVGVSQVCKGDKQRL